MLKRKIIFIGIVFITSFIHENIYSQDFEVAPVKLEFTTEPGENQIKTITVKNHSNKKESFIISISDFLPSSTGGFNYMQPNSTKRSCANWLNITPSFFELNPNDEMIVQISMMVPNDQFSAAWCSLYLQTTLEQTSWSSDKNLGTGVTVTGRIGILIYQSPKSNTNHSIKISNLLEVTKLGDRNRKFSATIENLGDKITKCKVYLVASNMRTAEEKQFTSIEIETFPKMSRTIELVMPDELTPGKYSLAAILDYGAKYSLEGTQIFIDVKEQFKANNSETTKVTSDTSRVK